MLSEILMVHPGLAANSRLPELSHLGKRSDQAVLLLLVFIGVLAAVATVLLDFHLRIPGHAILRSILPMAFGLALTKRSNAGSVMGTTALCSAVMLKMGGIAAPGAGALASLALTGTLLDLAARRVRTGWQLYLAFGLAGLTSNLGAFAIRAFVKSAGLDHGAARPLEDWWLSAIGTYSLSGLIAGVISAVFWFRLSSHCQQLGPNEEQP